jgi:hypothetical protein
MLAPVALHAYRSTSVDAPLRYASYLYASNDSSAPALKALDHPD